MALNVTGSNDDLGSEWVWYPTVCKIPRRGLQLFASRYIVMEYGEASNYIGTDKRPAEYASLTTTLAYWSDFFNLGLPKLTQKKRHGKGGRKHGKGNKHGHGGPNQDFQRWKTNSAEKDAQACRTVRLISDLKKKGSGGLVPDVVKGAADVAEGAVEAVDSLLT